MFLGPSGGKTRVCDSRISAQEHQRLLQFKQKHHRTLSPHLTTGLFGSDRCFQWTRSIIISFLPSQSSPAGVCSVANAQQTQYTSSSRTIRSLRQMCRLVLVCARFSHDLSAMQLHHVCLLSSPIQLPQTELQGNVTPVSNRDDKHSSHDWAGVVFSLLWNTHTQTGSLVCK